MFGNINIPKRMRRKVNQKMLKKTVKCVCTEKYFRFLLHFIINQNWCNYGWAQKKKRRRKRFKMFTSNNEGQSEIGSVLILPYARHQSKNGKIILDLIQRARISRTFQTLEQKNCLLLCCYYLRDSYSAMEKVILKCSTHFFLT